MSLGVVLLASALAWASSPADYATPDSTNYLNAALHLAGGNGYVTSAVEWGAPGSNGPITVFAPGFPATAALLIASGLSARTALSALVGASFVLYALATWLLMRLSLPERARALAAPITIALMIQPAVGEALDTALSDLFGAALALCCAVLLFRTPSPSTRASQWIGLALGFAILGRWANLYVAVAACIALLLFAWPELPRRVRMLRVLHVGIPISLVVAPVWARNFWATGTLMGNRTVEVKDPIVQLGQAFVGAAHWLVTAHRHLADLPWLATLHGALALALGFFLISAPLSSGDYRARTGFTLAAGYVLAMVLSSSIVRYDSLAGSRFWLLVAPLVTASGICALAASAYPPILKGAISGTWLALGVHALVVAGTSFGRELLTPSEPTGYFGEPFATSQVIAKAIAMHDTQQCQLASDEEFALLPKVGTRPLLMVRSKDRRRLSLYEGTPLCLVLVRDAEDHDVRAHVLRLAKQGRVSLELADAVGELWMINPSQQQARLK